MILPQKNPPKIKKFASWVFAILAITLITSCNNPDDVGCVGPSQFYGSGLRIESNPKNYRKPKNIYGNYSENLVQPGQTTEWVDTNMITNGEEFIIRITGSWTTTSMGTIDNDASLKNLEVCPICTRNPIDPQSPNGKNCICQNEIEDQFLNHKTDNGKAIRYFKPINLDYFRYGEIGSIQGSNTLVNCRAGTESDPFACSCQPPIQGTSLSDPDNFHYSLYQSKRNLDSNGRLLIVDSYHGDIEAQKPCRFRAGMGAFISLWGSDGNTIPERVYHLYSTEKSCPISTGILKDASGKPILTLDGKKIETCQDDNNKDRWEYVFRSADKKIFRKNDTQYHQRGEVVKMLIYDNFYRDNFGGYDIYFLSGVERLEDEGILEKIVASTEDIVLGEEKAGTRQNGIVEFMFRALTNDNAFIQLVKMVLILYVMLFGIGYFIGLVELNRKEVVMRFIKIGFVMAFTSYSNWMLYKDLVVDFFVGGMHSLVSYVSSLFSNYAGQESLGSSATSVLYAKANAGLGDSGRFAYADAMIKDITSSPSSKKIWGLFFMEGGSAFGLFYIIIIYSLFFYLVYVLLSAALIYLVSLIKLVFALCLGPIFFCFMLFSKTEQMYKNWIGFVGARSLEMMILFLVMTPLLIEINLTFKEMLFYTACVIDWDISPLTTSTVIVSKIGDRNLFTWIYFFLKLVALIFFTSSAINKSAEVSGQLINIGGVPNREPKSEESYSGGAISIITGKSGIMATALTSAVSAIRSKYIGGLAAKGARSGFKFATKLARASGVSEYIGNKMSKIPILREMIKYPGPRSMIRNAYIDGAINRASAAADSQGLTGKARDSYIRRTAMNDLRQQERGNKNLFVLLGIDNKNIEQRFDKKLVQDPLKARMKSIAEKLKKDGFRDPQTGETKFLVGKELRQKIRELGIDWAKNNLVGDGAKLAEKYLAKGNPNSIRDHVRKYAIYNPKAFAEKFKNDREMQEKFYAEAQLNAVRMQRKQFGEGQTAPYQRLAKIERGIGAVRDKIVGKIKGKKQNRHLSPNNDIRKFERELRKQQQSELAKKYKNDPNKYNQEVKKIDGKVDDLKIAGIKRALAKVEEKITEQGKKMEGKTPQQIRLADVERMARLKFDRERLLQKLPNQSREEYPGDFAGRIEQRTQQNPTSPANPAAASPANPGQNRNPAAASPANPAQAAQQNAGARRVNFASSPQEIIIGGSNFGQNNDLVSVDALSSNLNRAIPPQANQQRVNIPPEARKGILRTALAKQPLTKTNILANDQKQAQLATSQLAQQLNIPKSQAAKILPNNKALRARYQQKSSAEKIAELRKQSLAGLEIGKTSQQRLENLRNPETTTKAGLPKKANEPVIRQEFGAKKSELTKNDIGDINKENLRKTPNEGQTLKFSNANKPIGNTQSTQERLDSLRNQNSNKAQSTQERLDSLREEVSQAKVQLQTAIERIDIQASINQGKKENQTSSANFGQNLPQAELVDQRLKTSSKEVSYIATSSQNLAKDKSTTQGQNFDKSDKSDKSIEDNSVKISAGKPTQKTTQNATESVAQKIAKLREQDSNEKMPLTQSLEDRLERLRSSDSKTNQDFAVKNQEVVSRQEFKAKTTDSKQISQEEAFDSQKITIKSEEKASEQTIQTAGNQLNLSKNNIEKNLREQISESKSTENKLTLSTQEKLDAIQENSQQKASNQTSVARQDFYNKTNQDLQAVQISEISTSQQTSSEKSNESESKATTQIANDVAFKSQNIAQKFAIKNIAEKTGSKSINSVAHRIAELREQDQDGKSSLKLQSLEEKLEILRNPENIDQKQSQKILQELRQDFVSSIISNEEFAEFREIIEQRNSAISQKSKEDTSKEAQQIQDLELLKTAETAKITEAGETAIKISENGELDKIASANQDEASVKKDQAEDIAATEISTQNQAAENQAAKADQVEAEAVQATEISAQNQAAENQAAKADQVEAEAVQATEISAQNQAAENQTSEIDPIKSEQISKEPEVGAIDTPLTSSVNDIISIENEKAPEEEPKSKVDIALEEAKDFGEKIEEIREKEEKLEEFLKQLEEKEQSSQRKDDDSEEELAKEDKKFDPFSKDRVERSDNYSITQDRFSDENLNYFQEQNYDSTNYSKPENVGEGQIYSGEFFETAAISEITTNDNSNNKLQQVSSDLIIESDLENSEQNLSKPLLNQDYERQNDYKEILTDETFLKIQEDNIESSKQDIQSPDYLTETKSQNSDFAQEIQPEIAADYNSKNTDIDLNQQLQFGQTEEQNSPETAKERVMEKIEDLQKRQEYQEKIEERQEELKEILKEEAKQIQNQENQGSESLQEKMAFDEEISGRAVPMMPQLDSQPIKESGSSSNSDYYLDNETAKPDFIQKGQEYFNEFVAGKGSNQNKPKQNSELNTENQSDLGKDEIQLNLEKTEELRAEAEKMHEKKRKIQEEIEANYNQELANQAEMAKSSSVNQSNQSDSDKNPKKS